MGAIADVAVFVGLKNPTRMPGIIGKIVGFF